MDQAVSFITRRLVGTQIIFNRVLHDVGMDKAGVHAREQGQCSQLKQDSAWQFYSVHWFFTCSSYFRGQLCTLPDGAFCIEFHSLIGATDNMHQHAGAFQLIRQRPVGILSCT